MSEFFNMGGYAFYVWGSYGLTFAIMLWHFIIPLQRKKQQIARIKRKLRREQTNTASE